VSRQREKEREEMKEDKRSKVEDLKDREGCQGWVARVPV